MPRTKLLAAAALAVALTPGVATAQEPAPPHVMVLSWTDGFHHTSIEYGNSVLAELAGSGDFTVEFATPVDVTAAKLAQTDVVLFNSTTGRTPLSAGQRDEFERWLGCGGGFVGVHASADNNYGWPAYAELVGAQFESHPQMATDPAVRMLVEDADHPITAAWQGRDSFEIQDEIYRWRRDPRGTQDVNVLLSLDETTVRGLPYGHHQPIAWTKTFRGAGRVYYTNLGHNEATWDQAEFRESLVAGIEWAAAGTCAEPTTPSFRYADAPVVPARQACPTVSGASIVRAGRTSVPVSAPMAPLYFGPTRLNLVLDLSKRLATRAALTATLSWLSASDDYDLALSTPAGFGGSDQLQPAAAPTESATVAGLRHCDLLQIDIYNHTAASGLGLRLDLDVTGKDR